jgi:hypothetical protein
MNKSPNCLKVILNSGDLARVQGDKPCTATFPALTQQNDIIYNEFFNYVRQKNLPMKILMTGCITGGLFFYDQQNPFYVSVVFDGLTAKNEIASSKSVEFICQTNTVMAVDGSGTYHAKPTACQYNNLPKSNKNIGVELNDLSIFTSPITIKLVANDGQTIISDESLGYAEQFIIEFWLFTDE